ncbi:macro domain-containing protein [Endozoicomonas atrinae]|uniref:macro domain-containing protein n=1 Tax=Endozoicomonas atrinae TaxID=1333660 RepID=UPI003B0094F9
MEMDAAVKEFCDQVRIRGPLNIPDCGINKGKKFVFGRSIDSSDNGRLLRELRIHPALSHLAGKRAATKHELSPYYDYLAAGTEKPLPGRVTLVTCNNGLLAWVGRENGMKPYGIVSSVDQYMRLDDGVAKAVRDKFGGAAGNYNRVSQQRQNRINYGECFTYDSTRDYKTYDLNNCQTIHNVLVPLAADWNFEAELKNTFLEVFKAADRNRVKRVFCPLLGCGRAGGTGKALAKAVSQAKTDFEATGKQAPELILVGMSSIASDKAACRDFESKWDELGRQISPTRPPVRRLKTPFTRTSPISGTSASSSVAGTGNEKTLPGRVTMVTCHNGLLAWAGRENGIKPYGIVSSVDPDMKLDTGVAKVIKDKFGGTWGNYNRVSQQRQNRINYGECFTYDCERGGKKPSDLSNCRTVHNVSVPLAGDRNFKTALKNTFLEVFKSADRNGVKRVFCPLLGCGRAGGTGEALAQAVSEAKAGFEATGKQAPELILVGMSSIDNDKTVCADFESKWNELGGRIPSTRSPGKMPSSITSTGAATATATTGAGSGYNKPRELINGQLQVVMNADKGMFGYAKELSKQGVPFDLVNAANREMKHGGGIAEQFSKDLGKQFDLDTGLQAPVPTGSCYTTQSYGYGSDPKFGLSHCQYIHNVVAPDVKDYTVPSPGGRKKQRFDEQSYHQDFTNTFVSLLLEAHKKGSNTIVSCFIGCAVFGGSGMDMAHALHAAYQHPRIQALPKVPKLILVGWKGDDWKVHEEFIQIFDSLNTAYPLHLPSGGAPASPSSTGISGTAFPAGSGAIRKKPSPYSPSGAGLSPRLRPASPVSIPADSLLRVVTARKVSHPEGVLGYARKRSGNKKPFSLVNAVHDVSSVLNTEVASKGGVRGGDIEHMIMGGGEDALKRKQYYQCEAWDYKKTDGYKACQKIHSVLFPQIADRHGFSERLVTLLMNASPGERLLFPIYELEGVTESALNDVLNRAYSDPKVLLMAEKGRLPKLCVVRKTPASPMSDDDYAPMAAGPRLDRSHSKSMHSLFDDHDSTRRSASPEPAAPFVRSSSRYGMWDSTTPDSGRDGSSSSTASHTPLKVSATRDLGSMSLTAADGSKYGTSANSRADRKKDVILDGDGVLKCVNPSHPLKSNVERLISDSHRFQIVRRIPAIEAYERGPEGDEKVREPTLLMEYEDFEYGQLLSYKIGGKNYYISVDAVQDSYLKKQCFQCPVTKKIVSGTWIGNQPIGGKMSWNFDASSSLPGYEGKGIITITYSFPDGVQGAGHPKPGASYKGISRTTYLPDDSEGRDVLRLLRKAFDQRQTFTIGRSRTSGKEGVITWNDIHHKTNTHGGPANFGYPDSGYLERVKGEVNDRGIY